LARNSVPTVSATRSTSALFHVAARPIACGGVAGARDAVQAFAPPVVGGDAEPRDGGRRGLQLAGFFVQRHLGQQGPGPLCGFGLCRLGGQGQQDQRLRHGRRDGGAGQVSRCHMRV
jgi:hypothetical protein